MKKSELEMALRVIIEQHLDEIISTKQIPRNLPTQLINTCVHQGLIIPAIKKTIIHCDGAMEEIGNFWEDED